MQAKQAYLVWIDLARAIPVQLPSMWYWVPAGVT
jgi:hypothetical protein